MHAHFHPSDMEGRRQDVAWRRPSDKHEVGLAELSSLLWLCRGFISSPAVYKFTRDFDENRQYLLILFSMGDTSEICGFGSWFDVNWQARAGFLSPNCGDLLQRGYFS